MKQHKPQIAELPHPLKQVGAAIYAVENNASMS